MAERKSDEQWAREMLQGLTVRQWTALRKEFARRTARTMRGPKASDVLAGAYQALSELGDVAESLVKSCPHMPAGMHTIPALEWIRDHFVPAYTARDEALWSVWEALGRTERAHINPCVWWAWMGAPEEKIADAVRAALHAAYENGRREAVTEPTKEGTSHG